MIQIVPSHHDHGHDHNIEGARDSKIKTAKKAKVARPANAFILYRQHHHPMVKAQDPKIHNNRICKCHPEDEDYLLTYCSSDTWGEVETRGPDNESSIHPNGREA